MWSSGKNGQAKGREKCCSFCGKSQTQVGPLITGPGDVSICHDCTDLFREEIERMAGQFTSMKQLWHVCPSCGTRAPASHRYCYHCGYHFTEEK